MNTFDKAPECAFKCQGYVKDFCCGEFCEILVRNSMKKGEHRSVSPGTAAGGYEAASQTNLCRDSIDQQIESSRLETIDRIVARYDKVHAVTQPDFMYLVNLARHGSKGAA